MAEKIDFDTYCVYDNQTNKCIVENAKYPDIEKYLDDPKYSVVWNMNGMIL